MKKNLVLVGLMGAGKTTLGQRLSAKLKMAFIDLDEEIEKQYGPIRELFLSGEDHFRDIEAQMAEIFSSRENIVLSTGGGVVLRPSNMKALKEKGWVIYITRPVEQIISSVDTASRPLLKDGPEVLHRLLKEREPLYLKYADVVVDVSDLEKALSDIAMLWEKKQS